MFRGGQGTGLGLVGVDLFRKWIRSGYDWLVSDLGWVETYYVNKWVVLG